jgi:hypothetical protein
MSRRKGRSPILEVGKSPPKFRHLFDFALLTIKPSLAQSDRNTLRVALHSINTLNLCDPAETERQALCCSSDGASYDSNWPIVTPSVHRKQTHSRTSSEAHDFSISPLLISGQAASCDHHDHSRSLLLELPCQIANKISDIANPPATMRADSLRGDEARS